MLHHEKDTMELKAQDYKSIISLSSELSHIQDLDLLLERILFEARKRVNADAGSIYVKQVVEENGARTEKLLIKYAQNDTLQKKLPHGRKMIYSVFSVPIDEKSVSGYCAMTGEIINISDMYNIPSNAPYSFNSYFDQISGYKTVSTLTFPLIAPDGRTLGVIQVINARDKHGHTVPFTNEDVFLVNHFADNATLGLQRAFMTRMMILRMIRMSELRDPKETGPHVNRVAGYAVEIYDRWAFHHGVSDSERDRVRDMIKIAAMLHDVGKVAIADEILKKPARFTHDEYKIMQTHTIYGAELFHDPQSPEDNIAREIALTHHENWDGTGYPGWVDPVTMLPVKTGEDGNVLGKKGEEIPLWGRIVAIADVYDALCSKRVYKDPWSEEDVLNEVRKLSGSKFDPELVDIFFEVLPNIKQMQTLYPEI